MIRLAQQTDLQAINCIYNHYVDHSTCTFHKRHETMEDRRAWFDDHDDRHPVTVYEVDGGVVAWASLSAYHSRCAYDGTVEVSYYVHHDFHRRGIGRALLRDLIARAKSFDYHVLIGGVCTEHSASMCLLESEGFAEVARFCEVGRKFDRWLDVAHFQRTL